MQYYRRPNSNCMPIVFIIYFHKLLPARVRIHSAYLNNNAGDLTVHQVPNKSLLWETVNFISKIRCSAKQKNKIYL